MNFGYWHRHQDCKLAYEPKTNVEFWQNKFEKNVARDKKAMLKISESGWEPYVIWECETRDDIEAAIERLVLFLENRQQ